MNHLWNFLIIVALVLAALTVDSYVGVSKIF